MADRSHLSIGEVLSLLQDDFPDVTISKIRFLESQGLLDPERTPSGYRKFYEGDIERLRWILRHQRDHFLPLKVIKDRLEDSARRGLVVPPDEPMPDSASSAPQSPEAAAPQHMSGVSVDEDPRADDDFSPIPAAVRRRPGRGGAPTLDLAGGADRSEADPSGVDPAAGAPPVPPAGADPAAADPSPGAGQAPDAAAVAATASEPVSSAPAGPTSEPASPAGPAGAATPAATLRAPAARPAPSMPPLPHPAATDGTPLDGGPTGGSFTPDELLAASGLDAKALAELSKFGLVVGRTVGGDTFYDEDALVVARSAAGFVRFGIEARHLRMYKVAAEREAGFMEQVVMPMLKQRNPTARKQAAETLGELARLGDHMRAALLRAALRDHTEPR